MHLSVRQGLFSAAHYEDRLRIIGKVSPELAGVPRISWTAHPPHLRAGTLHTFKPSHWGLSADGRVGAR